MTLQDFISAALTAVGTALVVGAGVWFAIGAVHAVLSDRQAR